MFRLDPPLSRRIDAADVVQEAYIDATSRRAEFFKQSAQSLFLWLRQIVSNTLLELHRRHLGTQTRDAAPALSSAGRAELQTDDRRDALGAHLTSGGTGVATGAGRATASARVREALAQMDSAEHEAFALRHFQQLPDAEAAQVLGIPERAAAKRYVPALAAEEGARGPAGSARSKTGRAAREMIKTLDYSRPRPRQRKIRKRDLAVVFLFLCAMLGLWRWQDLQRLYDAAHSYLIERGAMRYRQPADHVAYTDDADLATRLLASDGAYFRLPGQEPALYAARAWMEFLRHRSGNTPGVMSRYYATVFLHGRHNAGAGTLLVVVQMSPGTPDVFNNAREFTFHTTTAAPGGAPAPWQVLGAGKADLTLRVPRDGRLTVFTGQPDPNDASRFTIQYTLDGVRHKIDGGLRDDGTIVLVLRD